MKLKRRAPSSAVVHLVLVRPMRRVALIAFVLCMQSCSTRHHPIAELPFEGESADFDFRFDARRGSRHEFHIIGDVPLPSRQTYEAPHITVDATVTCDGRPLIQQHVSEFGGFDSGDSSGFRFTHFRVPGYFIGHASCTAHVHFGGDMVDFRTKWRPRLLQVCDDVEP